MFGSLKNLLAPRHSIILVYDQNTEELETQVDEVGNFYRFVRLPELVEALGRGRPYGLASVAFLQARQQLFRRAVSSLVDRDIAFTLFLRPDCIGVNRLPPDEEL